MSAVAAQAYVAPALADLESRAGASDRDPDAWHGQRQGGATATNVRDMWLLVQAGSSIESAAEAVARKKLRPRSGSGPEAAWGTAREADLGEHMEQHYALRPESRVFHSALNSRYLASPDGIGVNFDELLELSETKTGAERYYGLEQLTAKGYIVQQAWQMFVCAAVLSRGIFEERLGARGAFEPGRRLEWTVRWDEVAQMVHEELVPMADALLAALDRLAAGEEPVVDEELNALALEVLEGREQEAEGKALKEAAWKRLQAIGAERGRVDQESRFAKVLFMPEERGTEKVRVVDETHEAVIEARRALDDAKAALAAVEDQHSHVEEHEVVKKKASLTVSDPTKRKAK